MFHISHSVALLHTTGHVALFPGKEKSYFFALTLAAHFCFATGFHVDKATALHT